MISSNQLVEEPHPSPCCQIFFTLLLLTEHFLFGGKLNSVESSRDLRAPLLDSVLVVSNTSLHTTDSKSIGIEAIAAAGAARRANVVQRLSGHVAGLILVRGDEARAPRQVVIAEVDGGVHGPGALNQLGVLVGLGVQALRRLHIGFVCGS